MPVSSKSTPLHNMTKNTLPLSFLSTQASNNDGSISRILLQNLYFIQVYFIFGTITASRLPETQYTSKVLNGRRCTVDWRCHQYISWLQCPFLAVPTSFFIQHAQGFRRPLYERVTARAVEVFPRNFCIYYEGRVRFSTARLLILPSHNSECFRDSILKVAYSHLPVRKFFTCLPRATLYVFALFSA